jgi:hypothetical protein
MKAKQVVQVRLRSPNKDEGFSERTCLIDNARVRVGSKITLTMNASDIHIDWRVGGLR